MLRIEVIGHLTQDAEVKDVKNKKAINYSIAHNEKVKSSNGETTEITTYFNCVTWRESNVEVAKYLTKGTLVRVLGKPLPEVYETKQKEIKGAIKIIVTEIELLGGGTRKPNENQASNNNGGKQEDDLPF